MSHLSAERLVEALAAAVVVTDGDGRIVLANQRALEILERPAAEVQGRPIRQILPEVARRLRMGAAGQEPARPRLVHRTPSGREVIIGFTATAVPGEAGAGPHHAILFQDITAHERLEEERNRLLETAAAAELFPGILHELRNPLSAATATLEVLLEEASAGPLAGDLHALLGEMRRMMLTLDGVGLLRRDRRAVKHVAVDLALTETFRVLETQMKVRGIRGLCEVPTLPLLAFDRAAVRSLAFNLLNNAIQACRPGDTVRLGARLLEEGPGLELLVEDTGPGMPPEVLQHCRELFFTTKPGGTGVGLALCQMIVDRAGGWLEIRSEPGQGTRVSVHLPCAGPRRGAPDSDSRGRQGAQR